MSEATLETYIRQLLESHRTPDGNRGVAGRRADADEARVLQALRRTGRKVPPARPDRATHLSDQRHPSR